MLESLLVLMELLRSFSLVATSYFIIDHGQPGELSVENTVGSQNVLTDDLEGICTCRIPLQNGEIRAFNIEVYSFGYNSELLNDCFVFFQGLL